MQAANSPVSTHLSNHRDFYQFTGNTLAASVTGSLVWFGLSIWVYLETKSVFATSVLSALYMIALIVTGYVFGSVVDRYGKRAVMLWSDIATLVTFVAGLAVYLLADYTAFTHADHPLLWIFILPIFAGVIIGNIRGIALSTLTALLIAEPDRDRANGLVGTTNGVAYLVAPMLGGFLLSLSGMYWILVAGIILKIATITHLITLPLAETRPVHHAADASGLSDIRGTFRIITGIPGFLGLFAFNCINNFLGGVFMPLVDPYGLSLVNQRTWGLLSGIYSLGFIAGGLYIAKRGLGGNPLRTVFVTNILMWIVCIVFTVQPSIVLFSLGVICYFVSIPFVEAAEQTIVQKLTPKAHQGRIFGFQQSVEAAATPLSTLATGPIAQFLFIPFMTTGAGARTIGPWYGTGDARGIGLLFSVAGALGLLLTLAAMRTKAYRDLTRAIAA
jgi:DHA3 family multidrug efflux protein-like MFS transporter